ncbi:MAG: hypothetical protein WCI01_01310 [Chlorobiaceae bacterium]
MAEHDGRLLQPMSMTPYHGKYFTYDLTRGAANGMDRLSMALFLSCFSNLRHSASRIESQTLELKLLFLGVHFVHFCRIPCVGMD